MRLRVLGTGTAEPSLERGSSSYLLFAGGSTVLIDIGPAVVRRLLESGYHVNDVDVIILTHFHIDHVNDLSTFLFVSNYGVTPRKKPLTIIGGRGTGLFFRRMKSLYRWVEPKGFGLSLFSLPKGKRQIGDLTVEAKPVAHNDESIAVSIRGDKTVVFSGDTDYAETVVALGRSCDLLVMECSFPEKKVKGHLNLATAKKIAEEGNIGRIILSHLYPDWDRFRGSLGKPFLLAEDGMEIEI